MFESNTTLSLRMPNGVRTEILCASDPSFSRSQFGAWLVWPKKMRAEKRIIHAAPLRPAIRLSSDSRLMCHAADHLRPPFFAKAFRRAAVSGPRGQKPMIMSTRAFPCPSDISDRKKPIPAVHSAVN